MKNHLCAAIVFFPILLPAQDCAAKIAAAQNALKKAETVIGFLDFREGRAWAYQNGRFALIDTNGQRLTAYDFINPEPFGPGGYAIAQKNEYDFHLVDREGRLSEPYNYIIPTNNGWYKVCKDQLYTFLDQQGRPVPGWDWLEFIGIFSDELAFVKKDGKWAILDKTGQTMAALDIDLDGAGYFTAGLAPVHKDGKWGFIHKTGKITAPQFDETGPFSHGLIKVQKQGKWGLIDPGGGMVLAPQFDEIGAVYEGMAAVKSNGQYGLIDQHGRVIAAPRFKWVAEFKDGLAKFVQDGKWGYINRKAEIVVAPQFENAGYFHEGLAPVQKNQQWGYINQSGRMVIPVLYERAGDFTDGVATVQIRGKYGFINKKGRIVIDPQYDFAAQFREGLAVVEKDKKYGFINKNGQLVIPVQFDYVTHFVGGFAWVKTGQLFGLINPQGQTVIPPRFNTVGNTPGGGFLAQVFDNGQNILIDRNGRMHPAPEGLYPEQFSEGLAASWVDGKWGYIDQNFQTVVPFKFYSAGPFKDDRASVEYVNETFHINRKGEMIVEEAVKGPKQPSLPRKE